jgi:peptide/nickel transport system permease protein
MTIAIEPVVVSEAPTSHPLANALRRPQFAIGVAVLVFWVVAALTVTWWTRYDPLAQAGDRLLSPSGAHWMGTDTLGRDVFTRTIYGARYSLPTAAGVIVITVLIGSALGAIAGFRGGWIDAIVMRACDVVLAFPPILLAMAVAAALGPGLRNTVLALIVVWWPIYARLLRGQTLAIKHRDHIEAAVSIGVPRGRILRRHILPLAGTPVLINATMDFGQVVLLTASLSFLGLGAVPPSPEWGVMIDEGSKNFYQWWIALAPGVAILSVVMAFNFLGDSLRDMLDPRGRA